MVEKLGIMEERGRNGGRMEIMEERECGRMGGNGKKINEWWKNGG